MRGGPLNGRSLSCVIHEDEVLQLANSCERHRRHPIIIRGENERQALKDPGKFWDWQRIKSITQEMSAVCACFDSGSCRRFAFFSPRSPFSLYNLQSGFSLSASQRACDALTFAEAATEPSGFTSKQGTSRSRLSFVWCLQSGSVKSSFSSTDHQMNVTQVSSGTVWLSVCSHCLDSHFLTSSASHLVSSL